MASRSWNRVELIGNLTRDPEMRYTPSGAAVITFTIATNRTFVSDGEKKEEADFHRIVAWNKLAELCQQLLKKGNRVFVSGRLQNRTWEGQDGQQRNTTEIVIEDMILLTSRNGSGTDASEDFGDEQVPSRQADEDPGKGSAPSTHPSSGGKKTAAANKEDLPAGRQDADEVPQAQAKEDPGDLDDLPF